MASKTDKKKRRKFFHSRLSIKKNGIFATYINLLIGYMDTVVLYNIFFLITGLGIITIGPGLQAMVDGYEEIIANHSEHRYRKYFVLLKKNFNAPCIFLGLLETGLLAGFCYIFIMALANYTTYGWMVVVMALCVWLFLLTIRFFAYYHLQTTRISLPTSTILKNSFYFSVGDIKSSLKVDLATAVFLLAPLFVTLFTTRPLACVPVALLIVFSGLSCSAMMAIYRPVDDIAIKDEGYDDNSDVKEDNPNLRLDLIPEKKDKNKSTKA